MNLQVPHKAEDFTSCATISFLGTLAHEVNRLRIGEVAVRSECRDSVLEVPNSSTGKIVVLFSRSK
jgi:hypothetical protein